MKLLAKFLGRVNVLNSPPEFSYVTLKNVDTGEVVDSNAVTEKLIEAGITKVDDEFEVLILEDDAGKQTAKLTKLEPKPISPERIAEIKNEVENHWDFGAEI